MDWSEMPGDTNDAHPIITAVTIMERWPGDADTMFQHPTERYVFETHIQAGAHGFRGISPENGGTGFVPKFTRREKLLLSEKAKSVQVGLYLGIDGGEQQDGAWIR